MQRAGEQMVYYIVTSAATILLFACTCVMRFLEIEQVLSKETDLKDPELSYATWRPVRRRGVVIWGGLFESQERLRSSLCVRRLQVRATAGPKSFFSTGAGATKSYYVTANGRGCYVFYLDVRDQVCSGLSCNAGVPAACGLQLWGTCSLAACSHAAPAVATNARPWQRLSSCPAAALSTL